MTSTTHHPIGAFMFPATTAIMLREHTYLSDVATASAIRNYGARQEPFMVKSVKPGNHHYYVRPERGGFRVAGTRLPSGYMKGI